MPGAPNDSTAAALRKRKERIMESWEQRVRQRLAAAREHDRPALIDSLPEVLDNLADVLASETGESAAAQEPISKEHGQQRAELASYSLEQVVEEYMVLYEVLLDVLDRRTIAPRTHQVIATTILRNVQYAAAQFARAREAASNADLRATGVRFQHMVEAVKDYAILTIDRDGHITSHELESRLHARVPLRGRRGDRTALLDAVSGGGPPA
jgi:hypothetical protein